MGTKTRKIPQLVRTVELSREDINEEKRTVELSFSSEEPVERFFGAEILDHNPKSVRLGRLRDGGPLLMDHNTTDQIGVVDNVSIADRKGRALVRFGNSARANEIFQDVTEGIRKNVSVGYRVHKMVMEESNDSGEIFRVTDWEPLEVSMVSVPADNSIGVGRSEEFDTEIIFPEIEERKMAEEVKETREEKPAPKVDVTVIEADAIKAERKRVNSLIAIGKEYNASDLAQRCIEDGSDVSRLNELILQSQRAPGGGDPDPVVPVDTGEIGMTEKEVRQFSFSRLMNAMASPTDAAAQREAAFELEVTHTAADEVQKRGIRDVRSDIVLPYDVLRAPIAYDVRAANEALRMKRDLVVGTATAGGNLVATDLLASSFIDILRDVSVLMGVATVFNDLQGNIAIPRQTAASTGGWLSTEQGAASQSDAAFDQVTMSPQEVGTFTEYSRKLLVQSSIDIEAFVRLDLAIGLGLAIDSAGLNGSGASGQPEGIRNVTGIGAVVGGTNGAAPTWDDVVNLETEVAKDNAGVGNLLYLVNAVTRGKFKRTFIDAGSGERIWDSRAGNTPVNGYQAMVSNMVPSNLTKGTGSNLSSIVFGNFSDLLIGLWSGVDLIVNPYTGDTTRTTRVTAFQDADVAVRHPESFATMEDAITT